jgi:hypothetical protein
MQKTVLVWLIIVLGAGWATAQNGGGVFFKEYARFKKTTTLVVLDEEDKAYNETLRQTLEAVWKVTPLRFVTWMEAGAHMKDPAFSILVRDSSQKEIHRVDRTDIIKRSHLALYICGFGSDLRSYGGRNAMAQMEFLDVAKTEDYLYRLPALLKAMHSYLLFLENTKITEDNFLKNLTLYRSSRAAELDSMTLYASPEDLPENLRSTEALAAVYPFPVVLADKESIGKVVAEGKAGTALFHLGPNVEEIYVIGCADGAIHYYAKPTERNALTTADLKALTKAVQTPVKTGRK